MTRFTIRLFRWILNRMGKGAFSACWYDFVPVIKVAGLKWWCPTTHAGYRARSVLTKEHETIRWIDGMTSEDVLWDIGANVGAYTLYAASRGIRVVAFEPHSGSFHTLSQNLILNGMSNRVLAACIALSDHQILGAIKTVDLRPGVSDAGEAYQPTLFLPGDDLNYLLDWHPTHIKIDVDGMENSVVSGIEKTLKSGKVKSVMIELSPESKTAISILKSSGFRIRSHERENYLFKRG